MRDNGATRVAVIGSDNVGTDPTMGVLRLSENLTGAVMVGIGSGS